MTADWHTTEAFVLIAAWRTGTDVQILTPRFEDEPAMVRTVVDVRPMYGVDPAIVLEDGAFISGERFAPAVVWRTATP